MAERSPLAAVDAEMLDRHLAGECSEAESVLVRRYLMANPAVASAVAALLEHLDGQAGRPTPPDTGASLAAFRKRIRAVTEASHASDRARAPDYPGRGVTSRRPPFSIPGSVPPTPWWRQGRGVAAAAVIVALAAAGAREALYPPAATPPAPTWRTYATNNGERAELRLSDGTHIRMAPASRLRVASDFNAGRRDVYLEGEAYFDVTHDERRPFTVFAGHAIARDLGTQFSVRGYADDRAVQIVVRKGAVDLQRVGRLAPGDVGSLTADGTASLRRGVDVESLLGWLDGRLIFESAPLAEVLRALHRWHDVEVQLADASLANLPFSGELNDASFAASIDQVAATLGLRVRRQGRAVTLDLIRGRTPRALSPERE